MAKVRINSEEKPSLQEDFSVVECFESYLSISSIESAKDVKQKDSERQSMGLPYVFV
jgi:hypothetical protein